MSNNRDPGEEEEPLCQLVPSCVRENEHLAGLTLSHGRLLACFYFITPAEGMIPPLRPCRVRGQAKPNDVARRESKSMFIYFTNRYVSNFNQFNQ